MIISQKYQTKPCSAKKQAEALVGVPRIKGEWPKISRDQGSNWKNFMGSGDPKKFYS